MDLIKPSRLFTPGMWIQVALICCTVGGCAPDELCFTDNTTLVQVNFLEVLFAGTDSVTSQSDTLILNSIKALGTDSVFVAGDTVTAISIPVNTGANSTTYLIDSDQGMDTLVLGYERFQRFISEDCGPEQVIDSLSVVSTTFDSVAVVNRLLNEALLNNVEVYR